MKVPHIRQSGAHSGSATQRPKLPMSYGKRKRRSLGTHQSLQSARDIAEKEKREGGADGAGELPNWAKWKKVERRRKGKGRGR